mmetsp:Transcript_14227/g.43142  ORF Transcript_14227/g.43142 Transcript_14227/m.43142 type:complete len:312 (+) Transcript_14227:141-1076(+)
MATWYQSRRARSLRKHRAAYERRDCEAVMREIAYDLSDRDFFRSYRMDKNTFEYILARATPYLMKQKKARWDSLAPDVLLSMTLSWLRGGAYQDICRLHKVRISTFYHNLWKTLDALNSALQDEMIFPVKNEAALEALAKRFYERWGQRGHGAYWGCIAAGDGLIVKVKRPTLQEHPAPISFFCARYATVGIAYIVFVDADMKFLWCTGNAPGSTHDCAAFAATRLRAFLKEHGLFVRFLVFTWQNSVHPEVVERAFGMLVGLCLVLERPLRIPLFSVHSVVTACMRLLNVCIQQRQAGAWFTAARRAASS